MSTSQSCRCHDQVFSLATQGLSQLALNGIVAGMINAGLIREGDSADVSFDMAKQAVVVGEIEVPKRIVLAGIPKIIEFLQGTRAEIALARRLADLKTEPPPAVYGAATIDQWGQPRIGDWIRTFRGIKFHPLDIKPEDIDIDDIAHALSLVNRFTGHTQTAYSVAEHSVRVMLCVQDLATDEIHYVPTTSAADSQRKIWLLMLEALLHDASEAYLADIARPIKMLPEMEPYRKLEKGVEKAIAAKYGLPFPMSKIVKRADEILLCTEARDLMTLGTLDWILREAPLTETIKPWSADLAEYRFHQEYRLLMDRLDLKV